MKIQLILMKFIRVNFNQASHHANEEYKGYLLSPNNL